MIYKLLLLVACTLLINVADTRVETTWGDVEVWPNLEGPTDPEILFQMPLDTTKGTTEYNPHGYYLLYSVIPTNFRSNNEPGHKITGQSSSYKSESSPNGRSFSIYEVSKTEHRLQDLLRIITATGYQVDEEESTQDQQDRPIDRGLKLLKYSAETVCDNNESISDSEDGQESDIEDNCESTYDFETDPESSIDDGYEAAPDPIEDQEASMYNSCEAISDFGKAQEESWETMKLGGRSYIGPTGQNYLDFLVQEASRGMYYPKTTKVGYD
jgi:hypothetical protein